MITLKTDQLLLLFTPLHKIKIWEKNKYCQKYKVDRVDYFLFFYLVHHRFQTTIFVINI